MIVAFHFHLGCRFRIALARIQGILTIQVSLRDSINATDIGTRLFATTDAPCRFLRLLLCGYCDGDALFFFNRFHAPHFFRLIISGNRWGGSFRSSGNWHGQHRRVRLLVSMFRQRKSFPEMAEKGGETMAMGSGDTTLQSRWRHCCVAVVLVAV